MDTDKKIEPKTILSITLLYFLGHFLILLDRSFYSDGLHLTTLLNDGAYSQIWVHLGQFKAYSLYYIIKFLMLLGGDFALLTKIACFLNWLIAGIALYVILKKIVRLRECNSFFIAASFLLIGSFPFKSQLMYLQYSIANMLFFLAILLYFTARTYGKTTLRYLGQIAAGGLFFLSFTTNSLLVFYGGFLLFDLYEYFKEKSDSFPRAFVSWFKYHFFLIILPLAYWCFQLSLGKSYGPMGEHYNEFVFFNPGFLSVFFDNTWNYIVYGFFWPLVGPLTILDRRIFVALLVIVSIIVYFLTKKIFFSRGNENGAVSTEKYLNLKPRHYVFFGCLWFALGAFPYLAVGDYPSIYGTGLRMRYGILLPLGSSLIILGIILGTVKEKWQPKVQVVILGLFIVFNVYNYYTLNMDWYGQKAIVASLKNTKSEKIKNASTLIFDDSGLRMQYMGRDVKSGEYTLYLHEAFYPKNFKFGIATNDIPRGEAVNDFVARSYLGFVRSGVFPHPADFDPTAKVLNVGVISKTGRETVTVGMWLKLKKSELFSDKETFLKKLEDELQIEVVPVVSEKLAL
ncbi:MAG: hypothetical protein Q7S86_01780 [bacterium]|nr:hypothetical protein [bacterium]